MKIISIRQPWAALVVSGAKDVENRTWPTKYRGLVLIHASQQADGTSSDDIERRFGVRVASELPLGGIVGMIEIIDCVRPHPSKWYAPAHWAFVLANSHPLPLASQTRRSHMQRITHNYVSRADQRAALVINQTIDLSIFPETYWMEAVGDCLLPMVKDGTNLLFSQSAKPVAGDLVALFLRPEFKAPGVMPALVKRLVSNIAHFCEFPYTPRSDDDCAPIVICESTSPLRRYYVPAERLMAVHKCIAVEEPIT